MKIGKVVGWMLKGIGSLVCLALIYLLVRFGASAGGNHEDAAAMISGILSGSLVALIVGMFDTCRKDMN